jgi:hypothetical protein
MKRVAGQPRDLDMSGIIAGGAEAYENALRREYQSARERLQARLRECSTLMEQEVVRNELEELKRDFQGRLRGIRRCLFGSK